MTREEMDFIGSMNMCDEISNEAYRKIMTHCEEQEPCEDCISRQAAIDAVHKEFDECLVWDESGEKTANNVEQILEELPSATPQQKTGRWIAQDIHNCHTDFKCSECDYIHSFMHLYGEPTADYTYCPNCGAKMEVEE